MSGTIAFSLIRKPELLDIVDKAWEEDVLSPDELPLPEGVQPLSDEMDYSHNDKEEEDKEAWPELGLNTVY